MNRLRIVFLVLAVGVLGLVGWRSAATPPAAAPSLRLVALRDAMAVPAPARPLADLRATAVAPAVDASAMPAREPSPAAPPAEAAAPPSGVPTGAANAPMRASPVETGAVVAALPPPGPARAEDRLTEAPEFASFFGRLKLDFPRDYVAVVDRLDGRDPPGANAAIWEALRDLEQSQGVLAAQASAADLDRFFDARAAMLEGLAPLNAHQCADFLYGVTDADMTAFTAAHRGLVATLADRTLDAIVGGRDRHGDRAAPTTADLDALAAGLAGHGLSPDEIGLLMDGTASDPPIPDKRVCEIGRTYLDVLHGLPAETRHRIYGLAAELLARS